MNNKLTCHPDTPESGQQNAEEFAIETVNFLSTVARNAEHLARSAWNAFYSAKYLDQRNALHELNEARIYARCVQRNLNLLPPTTDFPNPTCQPKDDN